MAAIRPVDQIASKWVAVTQQRGADYETGVREPVKDWAKEAEGAAEAWKAGITAAIARDGFRKGVRRAGTAAWQEGAVTKGTQRWGPGVALAEAKYAAGFAPYQRAIAALVLPPRFARRDPRNLARVAAVADALAKVKVGLGT